MKKSYIIFGLLFSFLFTSCEEVQFRHPQPLGEPSISSFPSEFIGTFNNGASYLLVSKKSFTQVEITPERKVITGILNDNCILKKYNDDYYLSLKIDNSDYWHVANIKTYFNRLSVSTIHEEEDIPALKKHTSVSVTEKEDSKIYKIDPTYKEFSKIEADSLFAIHDVYNKYSDDIKSHKEMTAVVEKLIAEAEEENK